MKTIFKGCHYCWSFLIPCISFSNKLSRSYMVTFNESAKYDIGEDQSDVNKLFGFGYGQHHIDSDRFGWRYVKDRDQIEIVEYSYECGTRLKTKHICYLSFGQQMKLSLQVSINKQNKSREVRFFCNDIEVALRTYNMQKEWCFNYTLGLYFGGNKAAPHKISVDMKKQ